LGNLVQFFQRTATTDTAKITGNEQGGLLFLKTSQNTQADKQQRERRDLKIIHNRTSELKSMTELKAEKVHSPDLKIKE
jgi:hypothetical protein